MQRFFAGSFTGAMADFNRSLSMFLFAGDDFPETRAGLKVSAVAFNKALKELPIGLALTSQADRFVERIAQPTAGKTDIFALGDELSRHVMSFLVTPTFLFIPAEWSYLYRHDGPLFGERVEDAFPDAHRDIEAAGRCIALDESTAAVFHLMRAAELALQRLANELGVENAKWEDWGLSPQECGWGLEKDGRRKEVAGKGKPHGILRQGAGRPSRVQPCLA